MKKVFIFVMLLLFASVIYSQTVVTGNQSGVWATSGSPYLVTGDVTVAHGETLTIEAGVVVRFQGHFKLTVNGKLIAQGTEADTIYFTTNDPSTGWHGIRLDETEGVSEFHYCRIEYGKTSGSDFPEQHGGGIMMNLSDAVIDHCLFTNNEATAEDNGMGGAIYALNPTAETQITNCTFTNNHAYGEGGAIKLSGDTGLTIENCRFSNNTVLYGGGAICLYGCYDTQILRNLFTGNITSYAAGGAVSILGYSQRINFVNCTLYDNHASNGDGGGVEITFSDASFTNCIIYNNPGAYSSNIYLDFGWAEVNYCDTPFPDGAEGENNIDVDAEFVNADAGDFNLTEFSPCVDAGTAFLIIVDAYNDTITVVDMQPDEYAGTAPDMGYSEYGMTTGIQPKNITFSKIGPNPVNNMLTVKSDLNIKQIKLFDVSGRLRIHRDIVSEKQATLNVSSLENGIYFLQILSSKNGRDVKKIVVSK
jgi:parallel beta-helix repeat protein/predicted outer membrane repeat protein